MLYEIKHLQSRAACAENPQALRGQGGTAGGGRTGAPCLTTFRAGQTITLLDTAGPGMIRHMWLTFPIVHSMGLRAFVLRIYWDHQPHPSVEAPLGDFMGVAHGRFCNMVNALFSVQNSRGFNCWVPMPFQKHARVTLENDSEADVDKLFYQIDFTLGDALSEDAGYFHAQFRRQNPCPMHSDYTLLDGVQGRGHYLGTVLGVRSRTPELGWWGEGEMKFFLDGDASHPTICGTGVEDYVGFAWGLSQMCTPWQGCPVHDRQHNLYSLYRLHTNDPICFEESLRVTVQQIGCGSGEKARRILGGDFVKHQIISRSPEDDICYYDLSDDYSSVAYWYQTLPSRPFPPLPNRAARIADLPIVPPDARNAGEANM